VATISETHKDEKRPEGETHRSNELIGVGLFVLTLLGLFVLVAWLLSMAPESAGNSDLQYWMMP